MVEGTLAVVEGTGGAVGSFRPVVPKTKSRNVSGKSSPLLFSLLQPALRAASEAAPTGPACCAGQQCNFGGCNPTAGLG